MSNLTNIGITGFPNAGKTSLFNILTNSEERVENWPGVTTNYTSKTIELGTKSLCFFDLPSKPQYHTTHTSLPKQPDTLFDTIIYVLDATCFTQQMPMVLEWCETGYRRIIVISKYTKAQALGLHLDPKQLDQPLACPIYILDDNIPHTASILYAMLTDLKPQPMQQQHWPEELQQHTTKLSYQTPNT